tara:strand:- start:185 stop:12442 length:12258 start_codon:yes stop_codon:yes gene_type:complete
MATQENKCRLCSGLGEGVVLYRYGPSDYQIDADCIYGELSDCEQPNNPRKSYVNPAQCLVWFNDNGGEVIDQNGSFLFQNYYGQTNQVNPIPTVVNQTIVTTANASIGDVQSRLWAYDLTGNTLYYVDSFTHQGSDIGISQNNMVVGCQHTFTTDIPGSTPVTHLKSGAIVSYSYSITNNDTSTFSKTPQKTYRFVDEDGYLIREGTTNTHYGTTVVGLGQAIGVVSDTEILVDDDKGNVYYVDLTNFWSGSSIYADGSVNPPVAPTYSWIASNNIDNNGYPYVDLYTAGGVLPGVEQEAVNGWKHCSYGTAGNIYTVVANKILNTEYNLKVQGDIKFNPSDPILSGDPSFIITYKNLTIPLPNTGGCPQNPGALGINGTECAKLITRFKFPTDLNNITIQTYNDRFTDDSTVNNEEFTPASSSINIAEDGATGNLYGFSQNYRWEINPTTLFYDNPIQGEFRLYNSSGLGQLLNWNYTPGNSGQMAFRGGAQSPDCLTTSAYTYNCTTDGCDSVLGSSGAYSSFSACSADCVSYSCQTMCECITGLTSDIGGVGYFDDYATYNPVWGHLSQYLFEESNAVSIQSTTIGDTCIWSVPLLISVTAAPPPTFENTYGVSTSSNVQQTIGTEVEGVTNSGNQQSSWGVDGTRFCLDDDCTTYQDLQGPAPAGPDSGFWGATGNYLLNARLNTTGVFPDKVDSHAMNSVPLWGGYCSMWEVLNFIADTTIFAYDPIQGPLYQGTGGAGWDGMSRCVTVTGSTAKVYFIGVGSSEYYRIGIDGVIQIDTSRPQVANRGFNPNGQPNPSTNQDVIDGTGSGNESRLWWMHRFELLPGEHSITVEMFPMSSLPAAVAAYGRLAVPNAFQYKAIGMDIIGPFNLGEYATANDVSTTFTPQIYTANTILSTSELAEPTQLPTTCTGGACYLSECYVLHHLQEPIPYSVLGSLIAEYPDPYRVAVGLGGTYGWENPSLDPITLPNGGKYMPSQGHDPGIPYIKMREIPYYAPKTNGVHDIHPGTSYYTRELIVGDWGYVSEEPQGTPYGVLAPGATLTTGMMGGWDPFSTTHGTNPNPCVSDIPSFWGLGGNTYQHYGAPIYVRMGGQSLPNNILNFTAGQTTWEDVIDWLNSEGLLVSSVPDPGTSNYPNIDYNATYWQVQYAMADYWTVAFPNGAPNGPNPAGMSQFNFTSYPGHLTESTFFTHQCYDWCDCGQSYHMLDTQPIKCNKLQMNGLFGSNMPFSWNPITVPNPLTTLFTYEKDWIYDSCLGACVTTTGCSIQNTLTFSGGCTPIAGTGYTNTNVFSALTECEEICGDDTTTGVTYYQCGDSGCTTASTITPFTSLTQCTGSCISYNCTTTGCTEFNPPVNTANIGFSPNYYGTGGTFTNASNCYSACTSYQCGNWGCSPFVGSGGTFLTEALCTGSCASYECLSNGCVSYEGSGYTYSSSTDCVDICVSYECTTNCCELWNSPFYGTGGTFFNYTSSATSLTDCQNDCVSWGCNQSLIASDTDIFVFYDTTSMQEQSIKDAFIGVSGWTQTLSGWSGNIRHVLTKDERWLTWGSIPYTGEFTGGTYGIGSLYSSINILQWAYNEGVYDVWWDQAVAGQTTGIFATNGNAILTKGLPSPVGYDSNILNLLFHDESNPPYHGGYAYPNDTTNFYIDPQYSGGTNTQTYQPNNTWKLDYDAYTVTWVNVTGNTGDLKSFIYPTGVAVDFTPYEPTYVGVAAIKSTYSQLALNIVASIDEGNQTDGFGNPTPNGTWVLGTAPRPASLGGTIGGSPGLCPIASLTALELSENPYIQEGYGYLSRKGWGYNVSVPQWTNQVFQNDIESFLTQGTSQSFPASANTGCVSACTQPTANYPYSSQTECSSASTGCQYFTCTNTGCELATFGTASTFTTLFECEEACQSWNCNNADGTTGTTPCEVQTGTGGTFTIEVDCLNLCTSYQCFGYIPGTPATSWGCQAVGGTGSTFPTYSACSADCKSWECTSPCSGGTNSGCTQYPYSGFSYSSETACNDGCASTWWCTPELTIDACSGRTLMVGAVDSGINGIPGNFNLGTISDRIADSSVGVQFTNFSQIKYIDLYLTGLYGPNGSVPGGYPFWSDTCMEQWTWEFPSPSNPEYFVLYPTKINSAVLPGGPWFVYNDFIQTAILVGVPVDLTMSWVDVCSALESFYQTPPNMGYTNIDTQRCICTDIECGVQCENGLYPTVPSTWTGPYTTSGDAYTTCCANTWDCTEGYDVSSCSGRTNINIGIQYSNSVAAANHVSQNLPNVDVTTLYYESDILVNTLNNPCLGPNGGPLMKLESFDYALLNNGVSYNSWNYFIQDLIADGLSGVSSGMSYDIISNSLFIMSGESLDTCVSPCRCLAVECDCIQVEGSGGTYADEVTCLSALTNNTSVCDCDGLTGTSWNCFDEGPFEPTCGNKPYIGQFGTIHDVVDFYRANVPNQNFIDNRFTNSVGIIGGTLNTYPIPPLTWTSVWNNMSATTYDWMDCYHQFSGMAITYRPYVNIWWIAHPQLTGGNGVFNPTSGYWEYPTWNDFYGAAVAAGAPVTTLMSYSSACQTLDTFFNPAGLNFQCMTKWEQCCIGEDCWCVQQWDSGGTYTTNSLCLSACCPTTDSGYTCSLTNGQCVPASPLAVPFFTTINDCTNCLTNPNCQYYMDCNPISWECDSGHTTNSCSDSLGPINTISPGTQGNQVGAPFITNPPTYPFTSDTITQGLLYPTSQVENVFTDHEYWDPSVPFSTATYEINSLTYSSGNITLPTDICIGPNGYPEFRLLSIGHMSVNQGFEYNTWESFVSVASASPYSYNVSIMTTASEVIGLGYGVTNGWNVTIEPCICTSEPCGCVPVIGLPLGPYSTSGACNQFCCEPEVTYDCNLGGCIDPGNGLGAYTGYNAYNLCTHDCHEWLCNELLPPECECVWLLGTGNTGTNIYPGTPAGYYSCSTGCCESVVIPACPILFSVNDNPVTQDSGIYSYNIATNISQSILSDPGYTFNDVSYWQSPALPTLPLPDMLVFTYRPIEIKEWYITSNQSPILNRTISLGQTIGRGLTNINQFSFLSAESDVYEIDLINSTNTSANITTLFSLPGGYKCTGDISFDVSSNLMLILYDNSGNPGPAAPKYKLGKYNYGGSLLDEYTIPNTLLSGGTDKFDGIICNVGISLAKYVVSQSGLMFQIIETPSLSIAPVPINNIGVLDNTGSNNEVTGAEGVCGCSILVPRTYDCDKDTVCTDPGTGLGQFTLQTALANGYLSALDECQATCSADCKSWSCVTETNSYNSCDTLDSGIAHGLGWTHVLFDWLSLNLVTTNFSNIHAENTNWSPLPHNCPGPNGGVLGYIDYISCNGPCSDAAMNQHFYDFPSFISVANSLGIGVSLGHTMNQMNTIISQHYSFQAIFPGILIYGKHCQCGQGVECHCTEIDGNSGYPTEQECLDICCPLDPPPICASIYTHSQCNTGNPLWDGQVQPLFPWTTGCCVLIDGQTPGTTHINSIILNPVDQGYHIIDAVMPCQPTAGCDCNTPTNYNTVSCGVTPNLNSSDCLSQTCPVGLLWDYTICSCTTNRGSTIFVGDEPHLAVMISDISKKSLKEVTTVVSQKVQLVELKTYNCISLNEKEGQRLFNGCLAKSDDTSNQYIWNTTEQNPLTTFTCVNGLCIELKGNSGGYASLIECVQNCDTISGDGSKPSFLPPTEDRKYDTGPCDVEDIGPTNTTGLVTANQTYDNSNKYMCKTTLNPLVGEYQKACVPISEITGSVDDGVLYGSLEACTYGCGGWYNCNVDNIDVNGITTNPNQAAPILMCCESYIMEATQPLTVQSCGTNCCDGTETWFPLYNVFGINKTYDSTLSYLNRRLTSLINSQICTVSKTKQTYINEGKSPINSSMNVSSCGGSSINYVDDKPCYPTVVEALSEATRQGCAGYHTHQVNETMCYMACKSHSQTRRGDDDPGIGYDYQGPTNQLTIKYVDGPINRCCPVTNQPGTPSWVSVNPCGGNNIYTGVPVLGSGCGPNPNAAGGASDPLWCCTYDIVTGSDRVLKQNIVKVGTSPSGINIYEFEYKDKSFGEGTFNGVIAQEVPQASIRKEDGYLYVNYSQIDVDFKKVR